MKEHREPQNPQPNYWGTTPEEEYYAQQNIKSTKSFYTNPNTNQTLFTRSWLPLSTPPLGIICMLHGYGNDISWTFQGTPIYLAQNGFACFALDLPGHGQSNGLKAFVPNVDHVVNDCIAFFISIVELPHYVHLPAFLFGESMGGAICLLISLKMIDQRFKVYAEIADCSNTFTPDLLDKSVKVPAKKLIAVKNPLRYKGKPRLGTVIELLRVTDYLSAKLNDVTIPFIILHGNSDGVTDPNVSRDLYKEAKSKDKAIKIYEGMLHSLLFGETDENVASVRGDILSWLNDRCNRES